MKRRIRALCAHTFLLASVPCCGGSDGFPAEWGSVDEVSSALVNHNALNPNALNPNALNPNALDPIALAPNRLASNALSAAVRAAITRPGELGAMSRQLLQYIVSCALTPSQSFRFSWRDERGELREEVYRGYLGLAASWAIAPLSESREQWVSACVASRANRAGVSVMISSRAAHLALRHPDASEVESYPMEEGAFWGNLFATPPRLYACYNESNVESARALSRDCAAGLPEPGGGVRECPNIHIVGSCDLACDAPGAADGYRPSCTDDRGESWSAVITTFLP
ncbi:hypothetical protein predicted by Glimmer/Critica [Sorangium cellulosum So ce56]|uniref:Secreted protein n=1 Tax=Sorangium cellulosum (strain So ce56) TaxID=448385 RepID=A9G4G8_SORC5|nr:hypothetical protein predicted by Glimmer/Critica [Sorangium cellulosum So ce56]